MSEPDWPLIITEPADLQVAFRLRQQDGSASSWEFVLDAHTGEFWLQEADSEHGEAFFDYPTDFADRIHTRNLSWIAETDVQAITEIAHELAYDGWLQLHVALTYGDALIKARPGNIFAPFETLPFDIWHGCQVIPRRDDKDPERQIFDAVWPDGSKAYSIFCAAGSQQISLAQASSSSIGAAQKQCLRWLVKLRKDNPSGPPGTRMHLKTDALQRFEGLMGKGFDRMWQRAREQIPQRRWDHPGRPSGSRAKTPPRKNPPPRNRG